MLPLKASGARYLWLSLIVIISDQAAKWLCVHFIEHGTMGICITPFFNLVHVYNYGAAFSFLAQMGGWQRWLFAAAAVIIGLCFVLLLLRTPKTARWSCVAFALFIGGAAGNLIDRIHLGYVIDFLLFYIRGDDFFWAYPAFNIADIAICSGAALLVLIALFGRHSSSSPKAAASKPASSSEPPRI